MVRSIKKNLLFSVSCKIEEEKKSKSLNNTVDEKRIHKQQRWINWFYKQYFKGTMSRDFRLFFIKKLHLGPIWTGINGFANIFAFAKLFAKIGEIRVSA